MIGPLLGRLVLHRYLGIWLFVEAPSILYGIAYTTPSPTTSSSSATSSSSQWTAARNIDPYSLETATSLKQVISAFNVSTNQWSKNYIFKRLRFLGNKHASQLGTLFFLAIWHGFHVGYFLTFALEFFVVLVEGWNEEWLASYGCLNHPVALVVRWFITQWMLGFPMIGFEYKTWSKTTTLWSQQAFAPLWFLGGCILLHTLRRAMFPSKPLKQQSQPQKQKQQDKVKSN